MLVVHVTFFHEIGLFNGIGSRTSYFPKYRILHGSLANKGHIIGCCIMFLVKQSVRIIEMSILATK